MSANENDSVICYKPTDYDPFEGDFGGSEDRIFSDKMTKSRKNHKCSQCCGNINKGEVYRYLSCKFDGDIHQFKWCPECCAAMVQELKNWDSEDEFDDFPFENRLNINA